MDPQLLDREKEFMKINSKLNAKSKKYNSVNRNNTTTATSTKPIQIVTSNHNFNYYEEEIHSSNVSEGLEVRCQKINISNHQTRKTSEVSYPRTISRRKLVLDVHIPDSLSVDFNKDAGDSDTNFDSTTDLTTLKTTEDYKDQKSLLNVPYEEGKRSGRIQKCHTESSLQMNSSDISTYRSQPTIDTDKSSKAEVKAANAEGLLKFLKSKVALVQTELEVAKTLNQTLEKDNEKQEKRIKKLTGQLDKYNKKIEAIEANNCKLEEKICNLQNELEDKKSFITELTSKLREDEENISAIMTEKSNLEKALLKSNKDLESCRLKLDSYMDIEKTMRESTQKDIRAFEEKLKNMQKGKIALLKAYKQQIVLIDNLKRQNMCMTKAKILEICEKEFLKVLNWSFVDN